MFFFFFFQAEDGIRDIGVTEFRRVLLPIYCPVLLLVITTPDTTASTCQCPQVTVTYWG